MTEQKFGEVARDYYYGNVSSGDDTKQTESVYKTKKKIKERSL